VHFHQLNALKTSVMLFMSSGFKWVKGQFHKFTALMKIRVGGTENLSVEKGDVIEYDGSILRYLGLEVPTTSIRGSINQGWFVLGEVDEDSDEEYEVPAAVVPSRNPAKAKTINTDLLNIQRGSLTADHDHDEDVVMNVNDRRDVKNPLNSKVLNTPTHVAPKRITSSSVSDGDGGETIIGRIRTPAKIKVENMDRPESVKIISSIENIAGSGFIPNNPPKARTNIVHKEGISIKMNVGNMESSEVQNMDEDGGKSIRVSSFEERMNNANPHKKRPGKKVDTSKLDYRVKIALVLDPDFPIHWPYEGKNAEKVSFLKKQQISDSLVKALYATESDYFKKFLKKEHSDKLL